MGARLRQVVIAANDRDAVVGQLIELLDLEVAYEDPGVAEFGLVNALLVVGDQFIEVISPTTSTAPARRWIDRNGGDGGYMAIFQFDDLAAARARAAAAGARVVWKNDFPNIAGTHLHPKDMGGAIVSLDWADPPSSWLWAGRDWASHVRTGTVDAVVGIDVEGADEGRWRAVLGPELPADTVRYQSGGNRISAFTLHATDRARVGEHKAIGGVEIRLV